MLSSDVPADDEVKEIARRNLADFHTALATALLKERNAGALRVGLDPGATASVLMTYAQGLWRMAMVEFDRPGFERQIELFLSGLGL